MTNVNPVARLYASLRVVAYAGILEFRVAPHIWAYAYNELGLII
jgi:hypothetical protein